MSLFAAVEQEVIDRLGNLSITARQAVESILAGQHRSVRRGLSVEFAGHREYQPGDDLRHLDWLVWARSDRYDVRQYEEETKLRATLVLDVSGSMGYRSHGQIPLTQPGSKAKGSGPAEKAVPLTQPSPKGRGNGSKLEYARALAAALGYLMVRQSDAVGLVTCDTAIREFLPPGSTMAHLLNVLAVLERAKPGTETSLAAVLDEVATRVKRRGLVILITDGFDDAAALLKAIHHLRHRKQEVRLFQVLAPEELSFPFKGMSEFVGLENEPRLKLDGDRIRSHYRQAFDEHQQRLKSGCHAGGVQFDTALTNEELFTVLVRTLTVN